MKAIRDGGALFSTPKRLGVHLLNFTSQLGWQLGLPAWAGIGCAVGQGPLQLGLHVAGMWDW